MFFRSTRNLILSRPGCMLTLLFMFLSWITLALTAPCWFPSQGRSDNGAFAELTIYAIHKAEARYHTQFNRYASLSELGPDGSGFIHRDLASGYVAPYTFTIAANSTGYSVVAVP